MTTIEDHRSMTVVEYAPTVSTAVSDSSDHGTAGAVLDLQVARRAMIAAGLCGLALIHVLNLNATIHEVPYVGWMFIGLIISSLLIAEGLMRSDDVRLWLAAGGLAASVVIGYAISRTIGLPLDGGSDKGNWLEPLGLATLVLSGIVVQLSVGRLTSRRS